MKRSRIDSMTIEKSILLRGSLKYEVQPKPSILITISTIKIIANTIFAHSYTILIAFSRLYLSMARITVFRTILKFTMWLKAGLLVRARQCRYNLLRSARMAILSFSMIKSACSAISLIGTRYWNLLLMFNLKSHKIFFFYNSTWIFSTKSSSYIVIAFRLISLKLFLYWIGFSTSLCLGILLTVSFSSNFDFS